MNVVLSGLVIDCFVVNINVVFDAFPRLSGQGKEFALHG